eukprot:TRINITY_DN4832_c0_g1_i1.p1 TRINITY_DN4832_c0_g1~~TRINITY_DN4832_c0_g1_i1.p1  ORF type:complete len:153 (-),score=47.27 TRINITY_DN4832_c0_g1_i1:230-688(-)
MQNLAQHLLVAFAVSSESTRLTPFNTTTMAGVMSMTVTTSEAAFASFFTQHTAEICAAMKVMPQEPTKSLLQQLEEELLAKETTKDCKEGLKGAAGKRQLERSVSDVSTAASSGEEDDGFSVASSPPSSVFSEPAQKRRRRLLLVSSRSASQ